eukprot:GHVN01007855.1.p1 GENE.GHVN01007855.1~~GHVN01007855.1.p1  ORF type:complete len:667 (+),score=222.72 GHVN01007855.1:173-2173(+)
MDQPPRSRSSSPHSSHLSRAPGQPPIYPSHGEGGDPPHLDRRFERDERGEGEAGHSHSPNDKSQKGIYESLTSLSTQPGKLSSLLSRGAAAARGGMDFVSQRLSQASEREEGGYGHWIHQREASGGDEGRGGNGEPPHSLSPQPLKAGWSPHSTSTSFCFVFYYIQNETSLHSGRSLHSPLTPPNDKDLWNVFVCRPGGRRGSEVNDVKDRRGSDGVQRCERSEGRDRDESHAVESGETRGHVTVGRVIESFPVPGHFHFRFKYSMDGLQHHSRDTSTKVGKGAKSEKSDGEYIWLDGLSDEAIAPKYVDGNIYVKVLKIDNNPMTNMSYEDHYEASAVSQHYEDDVSRKSHFTDPNSHLTQSTKPARPPPPPPQRDERRSDKGGECSEGSEKVERRKKIDRERRDGNDEREERGERSGGSPHRCQSHPRDLLSRIGSADSDSGSPDRPPPPSSFHTHSTTSNPPQANHSSRGRNATRHLTRSSTTGPTSTSHSPHLTHSHMTPSPNLTHSPDLTYPADITHLPQPDRGDLAARRAAQHEEAGKSAVEAYAAQKKLEEDSLKEDLSVADNQRLDDELTAWSMSEDRTGYKDIRVLLSSLHTVMWADSGWQSVDMSHLIVGKNVKSVYRGALIVAHPDKNQSSPAEQRYRAKRIFTALNESWKNFTP